MNTARIHLLGAFIKAALSWREEILMFGENGQHSEVARLLAQISAEYQSAQRGLSGLSSGGARHDFIAARTETIGKYHEELVELVGSDQAISIIASAIWTPTDQGNA